MSRCPAIRPGRSRPGTGARPTVLSAGPEAAERDYGNGSSRLLTAATITPDEFDTDYSLPAIKDPSPSGTGTRDGRAAGGRRAAEEGRSSGGRAAAGQGPAADDGSGRSRSRWAERPETGAPGAGAPGPGGPTLGGLGRPGPGGLAPGGLALGGASRSRSTSRWYWRSARPWSSSWPWPRCSWLPR